MLKITPLSIQLNYLDLGLLLSWPDTTALNMSFLQKGTKIAVVLDCAAVTVVEDLDVGAITAMLNQKDGAVPVMVEGFPDDPGVLVLQKRDNPEGPLFMCVGTTDKLVPDNFEEFSTEIWSAED